MLPFMWGLFVQDPLHFARRPSESAGVRFGSFTDVDIHVQQRISEFDKDDDGVSACSCLACCFLMPISVHERLKFPHAKHALVKADHLW